MADLLIYAPAGGYLALVSALLMISGTCPAWLHPAAAALGVAAQVLIQDELAAPLISLGAASVVFVVLVAVASRTLSGTSLFSLVVAGAVLPFSEWPALLIGLAVAAVVAGWRTWRTLGSSRVAWLTMDTMTAMGMDTSGRLVKPDAEMIPGRDQLTDVHAEDETSTRLRMYIPPYLLLGVGVGAALTYALV